MKDTTFSQAANRAWLVILCVIAVSVALYFYTNNDWFLVVLVPLVPFVIWGSWSGRFIVAGFSFMHQHASKQALKEWQGRYYQWENLHIRIYESGEDVWVVDEDLLNAVGLKRDENMCRQLKISYMGYQKIPETKFEGFNEKAVLQFLLNKQENNAQVTKLKLWFEREVYATLRRKREGK